MKLRIVLAALVIFCGPVLNAQTETKEKKHPVFIGLNLFGGTGKIFYRYPLPNEKPGIFNYNKKETNSDLRIGIDVKVKMTNQLDLTTGLVVIQETKFWYFVWYNGSFMTVKDVYRRAGIPLRLDLRIVDKKLSPFVSVGTMPTFQLKQVQSAHANTQGFSVKSEEVEVILNHNRVETLFQIGAGLDANFKKMKFQVFPLYEFSFWRRGNQEFNHTLGLALSLSYRL